MSIEDNRNIALSFCKCLSERRVDDMFSLFADTGTWTMVGRPDKCVFGRVYDKEAAYQQLGSFLPMFDRFTFHVNGTTAEADRVIVEAECDAEGPGAKRYQNRYLMRFVIRDGMINAIDEFFDPLEVLAYMEMAE